MSRQSVREDLYLFSSDRDLRLLVIRLILPSNEPDIGIRLLFDTHTSEAAPPNLPPNTVSAAVIAVFFGAIVLLLGVLLLALGMFPIFLKSKFWVFLSCLPTFFWLLLTIRTLQLHIPNKGAIGITAAFAVSLICDVLLIAAIRQSLRWTSSRPDIPRMVGSILVQITVIIVVFVIPFKLPIQWLPKMSKTTVGQDIFTLALFNIPTVMTSLAFTISLSILLLHRMSWPFLSQWSYILTRDDVLDKRKTLRFLGSGLVLYGIMGHSGFWWNVVEHFLR